MNDMARSLNSVVASQPRVFSLHDVGGKVVEFFASSERETIARMISKWVPAFEKCGAVCIEWLYGFPHRSHGRESL